MTDTVSAAVTVGDTVGSLLATSLQRAGDRLAVRARGVTLSHRELLGEAAGFAHALAGLGLAPGDPVALMLADRTESVAAYLGCFLGGFPAVHVNDRLAGRELAAVLGEAQPRALVYTDSVSGAVAEVPALPLIVVAIGEPVAGKHLRWDQLVAAGSTRPPLVPRAPDDLAIVGYTSGTTGSPKGVMHSQRSLLRILQHMPVHFSAAPFGRCAFTGTLSFVAGIWGVLLPHLYLGGQVSFMAGLDPEEWFDRMAAERSTFTYLPTPLAPQFLEQLARRPELLESLQTVVHSGSKMSAGALRAVIGALGPRFITAYGMTETGAPVTRTVPEDWGRHGTADDVYASAGRPVHIADITIVDAHGSRLPPGETGEIVVSSQTMFTGYFRRPELTAETMIDGRLRTGDIGHLDAAGYLYVTDRAKDMVVSGGMNVYPAEVEAALADLPGLAEIAVFGVPDERWGETVVAVAVVDDPGLDEAAIIAAARERLASYKKPTKVRFVPALPRTASLKIDKPTLRRQWPAAPGTGGS
jgi:acyl-CoA synthetase (AMP-forming)/AMP-acid ligase II